MNTYIYLKEMHFFAYHGVGNQETIVGNDFTVNLKLKTDISRPMETDDVADTVSYADVHEAVRQEVMTSSLLLEHVAGRIVRRLFADFPAIEEIELQLGKRNPPMGADIQEAGVIIAVTREGFKPSTFRTGI